MSLQQSLKIANPKTTINSYFKLGRKEDRERGRWELGIATALELETDGRVLAVGFLFSGLF